ncbi:Snf7 family protein [Hypoxylon rubiginosum]|uniref:Snf7 family protein n=1 Tax=Hypoxylon rubiginosum TaxID=110542 RepID=A0ACC0CXH9_9PEZI|nr:Snf7 family protein [Hypoxylon rubiginosum]
MSNRQLAQGMQTEFQARLHAKEMRRQARVAAKGEPELIKKIQELLKKGDKEQATQKAKVLLTKQGLARQLDRMADTAELNAHQIAATNAMNRMTYNMMQSSKTMAVAQRSMNPEKTLATLENYNQQTEEYQVNSRLYQEATSQQTAQQTSDAAVHELLGKLADDAGVQLNDELNAAQPSKAEPVAPQTNEPTAEEEDALQQRLRALRA